MAASKKEKKPQEPKKSAVVNEGKKKDIQLVELIERIPTTTVDLDQLSKFLYGELESIKADRKMWESRRAEYFNDIDNFVNYYAAKDLPFDAAANLHIPVTLEKQRAVHARLYQAIFGVKPPFYAEPQEAMDEKRLNGIYNLMRWALSRFVNYYKGVQKEVDEYLWNFSSEGWSVMHLAWERKVRKSLVVEEVVKKQADKFMEENPDQPLKFKEVMKWLEVFSGPVLRNIQNEDFYMPGKGSVQEAPLIGIRTSWTAHELNYHAASKYFDPKAVELVLPKPDAGTAYASEFTEVAGIKGVNQGYDLHTESNKQKDHDGKIAEYNGVLCYATYDIDQDGFDEEIVVWFHPGSRTVLRWTYLDRITKTGRRPIYKTDFIIRPGRNYALGLLELLHSLNVEVDAIHNQRVDFGTLSNMPFFFYRAMSTLPNQEITISPGKGIPVDDPNSDVFFPQIKGGTAWGFQEENLLFQIINRVSAIGDLNLGIPPDNSEAVRSQGQMLAVLNEGNAQLDIPLRRVQDTMSEVYSDIHQMLVERLPNGFKHVVIGEDDTVIRNKQGQVVEQTYSDPRKEIAGRVHFFIQANSTAGSKALMRSNRIQLFQQLLNPINLQFGIVGPEEIYEMNKALLDVSDEVDVKRFLRKPENVPKPLSLTEEIGMLQQGLMPEIPLHDDHQAKVQALTVWLGDMSTIQGVQQGTISPNALLVGNAAISKHEELAQLIAQQTQMFQNTTGGQNPMLSQGMRGAGAPAGGMPAGPPPGQGTESNE